MTASFRTASAAANTGTNRLAAGVFAGVTIFICAVPAQAAEVRMGVSATVLSHCAMQLTGANAASSLAGKAPFSARCNTAATPRIHAASRALSAADEISTSAFATNGRTQSAVINADDGDQRLAHYIQYTIEY